MYFSSFNASRRMIIFGVCYNERLWGVYLYLSSDSVDADAAIPGDVYPRVITGILLSLTIPIGIDSSFCSPNRLVRCAPTGSSLDDRRRHIILRCLSLNFVHHALNSFLQFPDSFVLEFFQNIDISVQNLENHRDRLVPIISKIGRCFIRPEK